MQESIFTIPVTELLEKKEGCPICAMVRLLEQRSVEYIMGAAMMEPDVRIETNRLGFCAHHFAQMRSQKNRLSLALILQSHLQELQKNPMGSTGSGKLKRGQLPPKEESCFVCDRIQWAQVRFFHTLLQQYAAQEDLRTLWKEQPFLCLPHYRQLTTYAKQNLDKHWQKDFQQSLNDLCLKQLDALEADVSHYCKMFDYRSKGGDWGTSKDSIERSIAFLTSGEIPPQP